MEVRFIGLCETISKVLSQSRKTEEPTTEPWRSVSVKKRPNENVQKIMRGNVIRDGRSTKLYKVRG